MVAHGFAKMLLSSGNPWPVTKQDAFHSLINYREENAGRRRLKRPGIENCVRHEVDHFYHKIIYSPIVLPSLHRSLDLYI